ncbi:RNA polymerase sigma factor SigF, partial [Streptomyces sp. NPDC016845]
MSSVAERERAQQTADTTHVVEGRLIERAYADPASVAPKDAREVGRHFFDRLTRLEEGTPEFSYVRNVLIEMNLSLVQYAASRFKHRGP